MFERLIFYGLLSCSVRDSGCLSFCIYLPFVTFRKLPLPWGNDDTKDLLATLKKHNVKATFFMTGGWIEKYPDDVKAIAAEGHDLGNHSENHKQMSQLSAEQCKEELMKPHEKVKKLTGKDMILFRPPYGDYNDTLIQVCRENQYYAIQWDVDTLVIEVKILV